MSPNRYAFINAESTVVNCITGAISEAQRAQFLADYGVLFGATAIIEISQDTPVWIGGSYTDGEFLPPPAPEPEPAPEPLPEPLPEPQPEPEI
jgi:hypothetical protein